MKHTALVITGICAALFVLLALGSLVQQASTPSALTYARQDAEINRLRREDAQASTLQPLDLALAAGWRVLPLAATSAASSGAGNQVSSTVPSAAMVARPVARAPVI